MTNFIIKCSNVGHRSQITYPTADPLWEHPGPPNCHPYRGNTTLCMSNVGHRSQITYPTADPLWEHPGPPNCHPYRGNTTLCMSNVGHRSQITYPTANPLWSTLALLIVILTEGILTLHVQCWPPISNYIPYCGPTLGAPWPS